MTKRPANSKARSREIIRRLSNETLEKRTERLVQMFIVTTILPCGMVVNAVFISSVRPTSKFSKFSRNWIGYGVTH